MADCSKYSGEEAGFDISAQKTSLIQYFSLKSRSLPKLSRETHSPRHRHFKKLLFHNPQTEHSRGLDKTSPWGNLLE
ncbi:unnamed protein product [Pleuronectes platessa]|uniref:Uncharacterized protein n=1 Tax=Pleuronectes platessa TaxID=8262 RepID=A0A9N7YL62_PLEPL|nr:unnamed protein product [Pleuronectes platessa]